MIENIDWNLAFRSVSFDFDWMMIAKWYFRCLDRNVPTSTKQSILIIDKKQTRLSLKKNVRGRKSSSFANIYVVDKLDSPYHVDKFTPAKSSL